MSYTDSANGPDLWSAVLEQFETATDPVKWCESRLRLTPDPWQKDVLRDRQRFMMLTCARQVGKSTIVAVKVSNKAMAKAGSLVLVIAPSLRQSKELMRTVKQMLRLAGADFEKDNETEVTLSNGSRVVALPGAEGTVRGFASVDLIVIDEAAFASDSLFYAVYPMIQISRGSMILLSSAYITNGFFYELWNNGDERWQRYRVTAYDCPRYDQKELEEIRQWTPDRQFKCEYLAEFVDPDGATFTADEIHDAFDEDLEPMSITANDTVLTDEVEAL